MKPDAKIHLKGGALVLAGSLAIGVFLLFFGVTPIAALLVAAGVAAGASVEATQLHDNRLARAQGRPLPHEVSLRDAAYSAAPCIAAAVIAQLASRAPTWPAWLS